MKIRQIVLLAAVGLASIWGGYSGYNRFLVQETKAASLQGQVATVTRGSLRAMVNASGSATVTRQSKLSFGTAGSLGELSVKMGDAVKAGQVLARLDPSTIATLQNSVIQAEANLNIAKADLQDAENPSNAEQDLASAERAVVLASRGIGQADDSLKLAQKNLDNPYSELDLSLAESAVRNASLALDTARRNLGLAENDPTTNDNIRRLEYEASYYERTYGQTLSRFQEGATSQDKLDLDYSNLLTAKEKLATALEKKDMALASAHNEVAKALDTLAKAQDDLSKKQAGGDPNDVLGKQINVKNLEIALSRAQDTLAKAQDDLAKKKAGPDSSVVERKRNLVMSAQAASDSVSEKLKSATITAPFDGLVASTSLNVGEQVGANTVVVTIQDPQALRIDMNVAETDIASLRPGQTASVTFDALAGQTFPGKIDAISPAPKVQQGVVSYPVALTLDRASGVKEGMTATAQIVYQQRDNVLLVPNRAIRTQGRSRTVQVLLPNGSTETRTIQTGMVGEQSTEVTDGLQEGESVVIPATTTTTRGAQGAMPGGFMPGGQTFFMPGAKP